MQLTEEEFQEKYGEVEVKFSSYYKFTFVFRGYFEGKLVQVNVGGGSEDIYRLDVKADEPVKVNSLGISYAAVFENGKVIDECLNYY